MPFTPYLYKKAIAYSVFMLWLGYLDLAQVSDLDKLQFVGLTGIIINGKINGKINGELMRINVQNKSAKRVILIVNVVV